MQHQMESSVTSQHSSVNFTKCNERRSSSWLMSVSWIESLTTFRSFIVICSAFFLIYNATGFPYALGVMYDPWMQDYKIGRKEITWTLSLCIGVISVAGVIVGVFINQFGLRATLLLGSILSALGTLLSSFTYKTPYLAVSLGIITGFGSSLNYVSALVAVSQNFPANRHMALVISTIGFPVGIMTFRVLIIVSVNIYGWRGAFWLMSAILLNSCIFSLLITPLDATRQALRRSSIGKKVWFHTSIFRNKTYMFFTFSLIFICGCISTIIYILPAFMQTRNYGSFIAATILTVESSADILGRLICSQVIRIHFVTNMLLYIVTSILFSATMILIPNLQSYAMLLMGTILIGLFSGVVLSSYNIVVLDIVGREKYSSAIGFATTACGTGSIIIGLIAGYIVERSNNFDYFFNILGMTCLVVMAVLIIQINLSSIRNCCFQLNSKGHLKTTLYTTKPPSIHDLRARITNVIQCITENQLQNIFLDFQ